MKATPCFPFVPLLAVAGVLLAGCQSDRNVSLAPDPSSTPPGVVDQSDDDTGSAQSAAGGEADTALKHVSTNWYSWRGPGQDGFAPETGLGDTLGEPVWTHEVKGGGTPVIADGTVYIFGYVGERDKLREVLLALDAESGEERWRREFHDFISDIIYDRYGIGSPEIDPETGNVFVMTSPGLLMGFTPEGELLWERSLMEEFGRLSFPNGRTGTPRIDGELVIVHGITANWGLNGAPRDRFYAFDKASGKLVWYCTPGIQPRDSSFSTPVFATLGDGTRVFYAGTGCGNVVCIDARTGEPLWRFHLSTGGINSSPVLHGEDRLIILHGKENLDESTSGRMVALKIPTTRPTGDLPKVLGREAELWRNDSIGHFTSSPTLVGDYVYQTTVHGDLKKVDARTGEIAWELKLAPDQLHASPLYVDGRLYVPFLEGTFFVVKDGEEPEVLEKKDMEQPLTGQPAYYEGMVYLEGKQGFYAYDAGLKGEPALAAWNSGASERPRRGYTKIVPPEFRLQPGEQVRFGTLVSNPLREDGTFRDGISRITFDPGRLGDSGPLAAFTSDDELPGSVQALAPYMPRSFTWEKYIPEGARVRAEVDAEFSERGVLVAGPDARQSAGAIRASHPEFGTATARGRVVIGDTLDEDFEAFALDQMDRDGGYPFAYPPLPWLGARFRYQIIEQEGGQVMANTLDRVILQRSRTFIGDPDQRGLTVEVDVKTDGNRRISSTAGVINQRYSIALVGNWRILEVTSNHDRVKVSVPFPIEPGTWYRLKTRVDRNEDGSGVIRAKAWERGTGEPGEWTLEVPLEHVHEKGAPGLYAFSPQAQKRVYFDNLKIYPSKPL